ncbi:hypothetical protein FOQG_02235 [Fusarium oxysporum f. sp. raphani 54005]|uniref:Uncharacterized protein n=3 Tax=Fusarium oxysporum TaxID=5507 RepID=X0DRB9_FUSOX|nr:hypothetical protein FOVG_07282 [Fusarium oxysporum f. sp. pisi HDV247]EXK96822.1 hypothetical protein FOQG_02235 [Fusarium oxysporum f. sp. raphani 54005]EXM34109.1 hypothetical protein FOTG_02543 [Fusarium oxysporum f. sp. vasinfectum 25433]
MGGKVGPLSANPEPDLEGMFIMQQRSSEANSSGP